MGLLKKIFKPVSKVLDKIIPNEIKPALPYLAAFAPYLGPMQGIMGIGGNTMLSRALMSGALNIGGQLSQEGSEGDINLLSAGLGALQGAMTAPGQGAITTRGDLIKRVPDYSMSAPGEGPAMISQRFPGMGAERVVSAGTPSAEQFFLNKAGSMDKGIMKSGLELLGKGSKMMQAGIDDPFSKAGLKAATLPFAQATGDVMGAQAKRDLKDLANEVVDDMGGGYTDDAYRAAIRKSMTAYGATEEEIVEAIIAAGYKSGGRVGMISGGGVKAAWNAMKAGASKIRSLFDDADINVSIRDEDVMTDWGPQAQAVGQDVFVTAKSGKSTKVLDDLIEEGYDITKDGNTYSINAIDEGALDIITQKLKIGSKGADEFIESQEYFMPGKTVDTSMMDEESKMIYEALKNKKASGGRVGLEFGGMPSALQAVEEKETKWITQKPEWETVKRNLNEIFQQAGGLEGEGMNAVGSYVRDNNLNYEWLLEGDEIKVKEKENMEEPVNILDSLDGSNTFTVGDGIEIIMPKERAKGGRINKAEGGVPSVLPKGIEADYRGGGFIPIGSKERADDVPARLSENEFVMTADAVRAAGGGNVNKGAQRMYNVMNNLEARA